MRIYAREIAFSKIYSHIISSTQAESSDELFFDVGKLNNEDKDYIASTVEYFCNNKKVIFDKIAKISSHYEFSRINKLDLAIICTSVCEIESQNVPIPVSINEAVSLAKKYSSSKSPSFVNGILGEYTK